MEHHATTDIRTSRRGKTPTLIVAIATAGLALAMLVGATIAAAATPSDLRAVPTTAWTTHSPESCRCHTKLVSQWQETMHAKAWTDPFFQYARAEAIADMTEAGVPAAEADDYCTGCHAPAAFMSGTEAIAAAATTPAMNGVTCAFCHQVTGIAAAEPSSVGNLSLAFPSTGPDGVRRAQLENPKALHEAAYEPAFDTAEFCGSCHNVDHPANGLHLETTYTEWSKSPYAEQGVRCQNCHMASEVGAQTPYTGKIASGPERDNLYSMTFIGANVAQGNPELNTALLKSAATVSIEAPLVVAPGDSGKVQVTVSNVGAGHAIPTGVSEIRQMWLEVYAESASGSRTELGRTYYGATIRDADGTEGGWDFWNAVEIAADNRIPAGESVTESIAVTMPAGAESQRIVAVLRYQSASDEAIAESGAENPTTDMAAAEHTVYSSEEAAAAHPAQDAGDSQTAGTLAGVLTGVATLVVAFIVADTLMKRKRRRAESEEQE